MATQNSDALFAELSELLDEKYRLCDAFDDLADSDPDRYFVKGRINKVLMSIRDLKEDLETVLDREYIEKTRDSDLDVLDKEIEELCYREFRCVNINEDEVFSSTSSEEEFNRWCEDVEDEIVRERPHLELCFFSVYVS